jgi:hypothetical protein
MEPQVMDSASDNAPLEPEVVSWEMAAILREKTPAERIACLRAMWRFGQTLADSGVRRQHPEWDDQRVADEVARRVARGSA